MIRSDLYLFVDVVVVLLVLALLHDELYW